MNKKELLEKIDKALDKIRPHLEVDGGNVELVDITDEMEVLIKWIGNCQSCNMSEMTLKAGIESSIKTSVPEVKSVRPINPHVVA